MEIDHWAKLLDLEEAYRDKEFLNKFGRPFAVFRPLFYLLITALSKIIFNAKIFGIENIPQKSPYIIAATHCSAADYPLIAWAMPKSARDNMYTITTAYFYDNPFARAFIFFAANSVRIDTVKDFTPALRASARILAHGRSLYINPEGTWSEDGKLLPFKAGAGLLSFELKVPIVPVYIGGTFEMLPPHALFIKKHGRVTIAFGEPIDPKRYKTEEERYYTYKKITDDLRERIIGLKERYE